jgi:hypothetical protein
MKARDDEQLWRNIGMVQRASRAEDISLSMNKSYAWFPASDKQYKGKGHCVRCLYRHRREMEV